MAIHIKVVAYVAKCPNLHLGSKLYQKWYQTTS